MFFIGNKKFETLDYLYEFIKPKIKNHIENNENLKIIIYYNNIELYNSDKLNKNIKFYISRGVKVDLLEAFILKYKGERKFTLKYCGEIIMENHV